MDTKQFFVTSEEMEQGFEDDGYDLPGSKRRFELEYALPLPHCLKSLTRSVQPILPPRDKVAADGSRDRYRR
jgi:hypothetical protein